MSAVSDGTFIADLLSLFNRKVTIEPRTSQSISGAPVYGAGVVYSARIMMKDVGVRTAQGTTIVGRGKVYLPLAATALSVMDRITLPSDIPGNVYPPILSVSVTDDEIGGCYTTIVIG